jgi:hypothetical protein
MMTWVLKKHRYQPKKFWATVEETPYADWVVATANELHATFWITLEHDPNGGSSVAFQIGDENV